MKKSTYNFSDVFDKSSKKMKKEIDLITSDDVDKNFDKNVDNMEKYYKEMVEINHYMELLLGYVLENNMTFYDYYLIVANKYRSNKKKEIPSCEEFNPFVKEKDIKQLIESKNDNEAEIFASELAKVVESSLINRK